MTAQDDALHGRTRPFQHRHWHLHPGSVDRHTHSHRHDRYDRARADRKPDHHPLAEWEKRQADPTGTRVGRTIGT